MFKVKKKIDHSITSAVVYLLVALDPVHLTADMSLY